MKLNYAKHKIANLISINKIVTVFFHEFGKDFNFEGESHNFWEMVYVDSGIVEITANGRPHTLKAGDIAFHKPNEFHTIKTDDENTANVFVISFVCSSVAMSYFKGKVLSVPSKLKKLITSILNEIEESFVLMSSGDFKLEIKDNAPIGGQQMVRTYLEQFLIMLIRDAQENKTAHFFPNKESMENHLISQMIHSIEDNLYSNITVEELCTEMNYSRAYLSKIFKSTTGFTILEYILNRKIMQAKKLIKENDYNFSQISDKLAFDNPHYFTRVFKRISGMTPSEYKNSVRK